MNRKLLLLILLLSGCASTHKIAVHSDQDVLTDNNNSVSYKSGVTPLTQPSTAYLAYSNDGYDDYHSYPNNGEIVMDLLHHIFSPYFSKFGVAKEYHSAQVDYIMARKAGFYYFILPRLTKWTQSNTLFTGVPNRVAMTLKIYNLKTNRLIDKVEIKGTGSKIAVFEKTPPELLKKPLDSVVDALFDADATDQNQ